MHGTNVKIRHNA